MEVFLVTKYHLLYFYQRKLQGHTKKVNQLLQKIMTLPKDHKCEVSVRVLAPLTSHDFNFTF